MASRHIARFIDRHRTLTRGLRTSSKFGIMAQIQAGQPLPNVTLYEKTPDGKVSTAEAFGKGTHVIFAIPGAFTPTCQNEHFPTFIQDYDKLKAKNVDTVNCVSVNDPFVMDAFCKYLGAEGKVRCLADTSGEFTKAVELSFDATPFLGNYRSKRYAMVVKDGKVAAIKVEENPGETKCSKALNVLEML